MKFIKLLFISLKSFFSKKTEYLYEKVQFTSITHILQKYGEGKEKCIACMICSGICPVDAIYIEGEEDKNNPKGKCVKIFEIDYGRCIFCGLCIEVCPEEALMMIKSPEIGFSSRREMILKLK